MAWFNEWWQGIGLLGQIMACAAIPMTVVLFMQAVLMVIGVGFGSDSDGGLDSDEADFDADFDSDADVDADFDIDANADLDADFSADVGADIDTDFGADTSVGIDSEADIGAGAANAQPDSYVVSAHSHGLKIFTVRGIVAFFAIGGWAGLAALTAGVPSIWAIQIALISGAAAMLLASFVIKFALRMQSSGNIDLRNAITQTADVYITIPPSRANTGRITMVLQERFVEIEAVTDSETALKTNTKVEIIGLASADCLVVREARDRGY